jgi:uncharacterized protein (DUF1330 family)
MPVKVIALVTINDDQPRALAAYLEATLPLLEAVGGSIAQRFTVQGQVVGNMPAKSVMIINYPSYEAVQELFESEAYQNIIPTRNLAFKDYSVSVVSMETTVI